MKKRLVILGLVLILAAGTGCAGLVAQQRALAERLIRFHVVADSDTQRDQAQKLAVRDALLGVLEPMAAHCADRTQMLELLEQALPELRDTAQQVLRSLGSSDPVTVSLAPEDFPTRYYDTFALPAGRYTSLRVRIGSAQGHNWWCVCFPTLCAGACTEDLEAIAAGAGFTDGQIRWMTDTDRYEIRFKVLEWIQALRRRASA